MLHRARLNWPTPANDPDWFYFLSVDGGDSWFEVAEESYLAAPDHVAEFAADVAAKAEGGVIRFDRRWLAAHHGTDGEFIAEEIGG